MIVDYHMHLRDDGGEDRRSRPMPCGRSLATALARGVAEIGFTEHVYYFRQTAEIWEVPYLSERCVYDLDDYCDAVLEAKRQGLPVKLGLEVDYVGEQQARLAELLEPYPFDYLLGSVHWLDGMAVDMSPGVWEVMTVDEGWQRYIDALCELAVSETVHVLAHPDLAKIFGRRPDPDPAGRATRAGCSAAAASGLAVEISTGGSPKARRRALSRPRLPACLRARRRTGDARLRCPRARPGRRELRPGARARTGRRLPDGRRLRRAAQQRLEPLG